MRILSVTTGTILTLIIHAALVAFLLVAKPPPRMDNIRRATQGPVGFGLCGKRRCAAVESRRRRRPPEDPPIEEMEVLEAALLPALGMKKPDPRKLPKLETYEQPEILEEAVNLDQDNPKPDEEKKKKFDPERAKRDPEHRKEKLSEVLKDFEEDDPRRRPTHFTKMVGLADGDPDGQGFEKREGVQYARKVVKALRRVFKPPTHISEDALKRLRYVVKVTRLSPEGEILAYRVIKRSGNGGYDNAAEAAIQQFVPAKGGSRRFPRPPPHVLRYITAKGMKLDLDGKYALGRM